MYRELVLHSSCVVHCRFLSEVTICGGELDRQLAKYMESVSAVGVNLAEISASPKRLESFAARMFMVEP